jgi:hypothetical protein
MTYITIAELCGKCIVKMLLSWLLMHLNLNPKFLIYIFDSFGRNSRVAFVLSCKGSVI